MKIRKFSTIIGKITGILMLAAGSLAFALEDISTTSIGTGIPEELCVVPWNGRQR